MERVYEQTSVAVTTNPDFAEWSSVFCRTKMTVAILKWMTHHCHIVENRAGNPGRFTCGSATEVGGAVRRRSIIGEL